MSTQNISSSTVHPLYSAAQSAQDKKSSAADEMQSRFLNLLITQLKNQDPLNPTDANQMTAQLSQISTVSGIEKLNASMEKLLSSYSSSQNMQAAAMIGKTVFIAGNEMENFGKGAIGGFDLTAPAENVSVTITDATGRIVQKQEIGAMPAGIGSFMWDGSTSEGGLAPAGSYRFSFEATMAGNPVSGASLQAGMINALTMLPDGVALQLSNNKTIAYSDIKQILN